MSLTQGEDAGGRGGGGELDLDQTSTRPNQRIARTALEHLMSLTRTIFSDRTGLLGSTGAALAGLPPAAVYGYLLARILIPVLLIVLAARGATPTERIGLVRDYLLGAPVDRRGPGDRQQESAP